MINPWFLFPAISFVLAGSIMALQLPEGEELYLLNSWRVSPWNQLMRIITRLGEWPIWLLLIICYTLKSYRSALTLTLGSLLLLSFITLMKEITSKPRPVSWARHHDARMLVFVPEESVNSANTSFPSGHTASAFAVFFIISQIAAQYNHCWLGLPAAVLAVAVGISRIFLVQHFLPDVAVGALIGLCFGFIIWYWGQKQL